MIITLAETGGAQTYVAQLLTGLAKRLDIVLAAYGSGPLEAAATEAGVCFVPLAQVRRPLSPWRDLAGLVELMRLCRRVRPDIVHTNSSKAGLLGTLAAFLTGVPIRIFTVNGWAFAWYSGLTARLYLWGDRLIGRLATRIICVAEAERDLGLAAKTCHPERTVVIHNAVDVRHAPRSRHNGASPTLVSVGRFKAPKDFLTLARAIAALPPGTLHTLVVGDGPEREAIEAELNRLGLGEAVELLGERDDVQQLLAAADIFALATRSEGLPLSILEAMAAGLPVVASAVGGVPELVVDGETGFLVPPGDEAAFATALRKVVADGDSRRRLGRAGRARAETLFDLPEFHEAHLELYRAELASRGRPLPA
jgi:glycosyltransferase involved in cell wall biosynthesis